MCFFVCQMKRKQQQICPLNEWKKLKENGCGYKQLSDKMK